MGGLKGLIGGIVGAIIGFFVGGPIGAQIGWFIGSSIGSFLDLPDQHSSTAGQRITDFKTMNSKYGVPLNRGYGTVRLPTNIVWQSAITESEQKDTTCIKIRGPFGIGSNTQCQTVITYLYKQDVAFALGEGPATSVSRIWADGELIFDLSSNDRVAQKFFADEESSIENPVNFSIYLGTLDQRIDPAIRADLGDDAYAFRSTVYIVAKNLDLNAFGYRIPVITAEVSFSGGTYSETNITIDVPIEGDHATPDFDVLGAVTGYPELTVGVNNTGDGNIAIHDSRTGQIVLERDNLYPDGSPTGFVQVSRNFFSLKKIVIDGVNYFGIVNLETGAMPEIVRLIGSSFGQITYTAYNAATDVLWASFSGGGAAGFPVTQFYNRYADLPDMRYDLYDKRYIEVRRAVSYYNGGGTTDPAREIFIARSDLRSKAVYWLVDGAGGVWINRVPAFSNYYDTITPKTYVRVKFNDGTDVASVANWTYSPSDNSFILYVDVAGTSPVGLYKIDASAIGATGNTVNLPLSTDTSKYLSLSPSDPAAFQYGPIGGILKVALNSTDLAVVDVTSMDLVETISGVPGGLGTIGTVPLATVDGVRGGSFNIVYFSGVPGTGQTLQSVLTDLMTVIDGDPRESLLASDLDLTELAGLTVKGFPLIHQQTVRNAVTPLQQFYFFDVVEGDGKLKFKKRPQTPSFAMFEDELAAHEYGKTQTTTLVPVEYERRSELELPRELTINYTDLDLDYNQGTQRFRKQITEGKSNTVVVLPIAMTSTEAAQTAEVLLNSTWAERTAPFKFETGPRYSMVEPTDTGTITMNDGRVHTVRILTATTGANNVMEFTASDESSSVYTSSAVGNSGLNPSQEIKNQKVAVIALDVVADFLGDQSGPGVVAGLSYYGDSFDGGSLNVVSSGGAYSSAGTRDSTQAATYGLIEGNVGHVNGPQSENIFDYETTITMKVLGGPTPTSKTESEALNADSDGLLIIGREVIAYTNVSCTDGVTVTGTDISFVNSTSSIDSVTTDFLAAGFEVGQPLRIGGASNNDNTTYWEISIVAQYKLTLTNAPTDETAGASITIRHAQNICTFSGGLLRGLYGTENYLYHESGDQIVLANNLVYIPTSSTSVNDQIVTVQGTPLGGGKVTRVSIPFAGDSLKPWSPTDLVSVSAQGVGDNNRYWFVFWKRRDKDYGKGLTDSTSEFLNSEAIFEYEIDIIDAYTDDETVPKIVRTLSGSGIGALYFETEQIADYGESQLEKPILVEVYQMSGTVGRGFPARTVFVPSQDYQPPGESFGDESTGVAYSLGTNRLNAGTNLIEGSGDISANGLRMATTVDNEFTSVSFDEAGGVTDIDVLTIVEMQTGSLTGLTGGVILRGQKTTQSTFTGLVIGLGGASNNEFGISHYVNGSAKSTLSDSATFAWSTGTKYSIRARCYLGRVQGKVWAYGTPEPGDWQLNYYCGDVGPDYGWIGPFAYRTGNDPLYHYFAWAHRGLTAA